MPLGTITDADLDVFISYLIPGISQANIDKIAPEHSNYAGRANGDHDG